MWRTECRFCLCSNFLCTWMLPSPYLLGMPNTCNLCKILFWRSDFVVPITPTAALSGIQMWTRYCSWARASWRSTSRLVSIETITWVFSVHMTVELACVSQQSQSFTAECYLTSFSSSCTARYSFINFHLSILEKHPVIPRWHNFLGWFCILSILQSTASLIQLGVMCTLIIYSLIHHARY